MEQECVRATITTGATPAAVFSVLADPASHPVIDGTGWVRKPVDEQRLTRVGQVFRMGMFHENHPDGDYEIANQVTVLEPPAAIAWRPGYVAESGDLAFGGWTWRYDVAPYGQSGAEVVLTYDWSATGPETREVFDFPPFPPDHLANSLAHLAALVEGS